MVRALGQSTSDYNFEWVQHKLIISVLGLAKTAECHKVPRIVGSMLQEFDLGFTSVRYQYYSWLSDQSIEKIVNDTPRSLVDPKFTHKPDELQLYGPVDETFLFPLCVGYSDVLHVMFDGALKKAVLAFPFWKTFETHIKAFTAVLGKRAQRECLINDFRKQGMTKPEEKWLLSFGVDHVDFEWA